MRWRAGVVGAGKGCHCSVLATAGDLKTVLTNPPHRQTGLQHLHPSILSTSDKLSVKRERVNGPFH